MPAISRGEIAKLVLIAIGLTGLVVAGAICPGIARLIPKRRYPSRAVRRTIKRLDARGMVLYEKVKDGHRVFLSEKGKRELLKYLFREKSQQTSTWDGKWRILMFDIPVNRRPVRDQLRRYLKSLGFQRLQKSVWIYPYPCSEILDLIRVHYKIIGMALYVETDYIDGDASLRCWFGLD